MEIEEGMNEARRFAAIAHCVPCVHLDQRWRAISRSAELRMGSHGMRTHLLASLNIPPQLDRTDNQNPRLENRPHLQNRPLCCWYIIFFEFV
jgi:hypothetical protein